MEDLRIEITVEPHSRTLITTWSCGADTLQRVPTAITVERLPALRQRVSRELQFAKNNLGSRLRPSWTEVGAALKRIDQLGYYLLEQIFGQSARRVVSLWQEQLATAASNPAQPPVVTVVGAPTADMPAFLPFECLPLFAEAAPGRPWPGIGSLVELEHAMHRFAGYACLISRELPDVGARVPAVAARAYASPGVAWSAAKFFTCRTLTGSRSEEACLRKLGRGRMLVDAWPRRAQHGTPKDLARCLWQVTHCTRGWKRRVPEKIHHFATHFDAVDAQSEDHAFTVAGCKASQAKITLYDLTAEIGRWRGYEDIPGADQRPMVFLNACSGAVISPHGIASLPRFFLKELGSPAFVGAETTVSDAAAAEFAADFYRRLLDGSTAARALYQARRLLVGSYRNPLGLFYTCYAHPDFAITATPFTT